MGVLRWAVLIIVAAGASVAADEEIGRQDVDVYNRACRRCHGSVGDGRGYEAWMMGEKARDLRTGVYKYSSMRDGAPAEGDLDRIIKRGIPRTAMPHHALMSETDRRAVVRFLQERFPGHFVENRAPIEIPPVPVTLMTPASLERGRHLFGLLQCNQCHGHAALGDGPAAGTLPDDTWGDGQRPADLTQMVLRSGPKPEDVFRTVFNGLPGTSMPTYAEVFSEADGTVIRKGDAWHLVAYIRSFSADARRADPSDGANYSDVWLQQP